MTRDRKMVTSRIDPDLYADLLRFAQHERRSIAGAAEVLIEIGLRDFYRLAPRREMSSAGPK